MDENFIEISKENIENVENALKVNSDYKLKNTKFDVKTFEKGKDIVLIQYVANVENELVFNTKMENGKYYISETFDLFLDNIINGNVSRDVFQSVISYYYDVIENKCTAQSSDFIQDEELGEWNIEDKRFYTVAGVVENVRVQTTKRGDNMAFVTIEDLYGTLEIVVFPREYNNYRALFDKNSKLLIRGNASLSDRGSNLIASEIYTLDEIRQDMEAENKELWVCFENQEQYEAQEQTFLNILGRYRGRTVAIVMLRDSRKIKRMAEKYRVVASDELIQALKDFKGEENVVVRPAPKKS